MKTRMLISSLIFILFVTSCSSQPLSVTEENPAASPTNSAPAWVSTPMTDAVTGKDIKVSDFKGKVVLVEGMATWCPTCWAQGKELKTLKQKLNAGDDFVIISLALDSKEDAVVLKEYASTGGFDWHFVTSTVDMFRDIGIRYGATYLDPTLAPLFIVDKHGGIQNFRKGKIPAAELETLIRPLLEEKS